MFRRNLINSSLVALIGIYTAFAAPIEEEKSSDPMIEKNLTESCFKQSLPQELQLHYDVCLGNNINGENTLKENEILSCILKTMGVILEEDALDLSKLKTPTAEDEASDMKMIEDSSPFAMSVEKCEKTEEEIKAETFGQCLYEALFMNCTSEMPSNEEIAPADDAEENL